MAYAQKMLGGGRSAESLLSGLAREMKRKNAATPCTCGTDMCICMHTDVCTDVCVDMCIGVCIDNAATPYTCGTNMCIYMYADVCTDMCVLTCA